MNSPFLEACKGKEPEYTPVWFMRQAGRYMASYRKLKGTKSVVEMAKDPEVSSVIVADAVKRLGVDAGIIFADIMLPLEGMGIQFRIEEGVGPVVANPVRTREDVDALENIDPEADVGFVFRGIERTIEKLGGETPLIGFSGAPFTLAGYMVEGGPSRDLPRTRYLMHSDPDTWRLLMLKLTKVVKTYLSHQVSHGVHAVQLFDSWVGCLSDGEYAQFVMNYTKQVFGGLGGTVPKIHFCADSSRLIERFWSTGPDVLSVDWRVQLGDVWKRASRRAVAQGNLDPLLASLGGKPMDMAVAKILSTAHGRRHVFSLGHGVLQTTPEANLKRIVAGVHDKTRRRR